MSMDLFEKCYQPGRVDEIRENHASLYDGCKLSYGKMLRYFHNDMEDLEKAAEGTGERRLSDRD